MLPIDRALPLSSSKRTHTGDEKRVDRIRPFHPRLSAKVCRKANEQNWIAVRSFTGHRIERHHLGKVPCCSLSLSLLIRSSMTAPLSRLISSITVCVYVVQFCELLLFYWGHSGSGQISFTFTHLSPRVWPQNATCRDRPRCYTGTE